MGYLVFRLRGGSLTSSHVPRREGLRCRDHHAIWIRFVRFEQTIFNLMADTPTIHAQPLIPSLLPFLLSKTTATWWQIHGTWVDSHCCRRYWQSRGGCECGSGSRSDWCVDIGAGRSDRRSGCDRMSEGHGERTGFLLSGTSAHRGIEALA